jgi:predicted XRE-type DNA-binding protein
MRTKTQANRFWSKVQKLDKESCWIWQGAKFWDNYGMFKIDNLNLRAHRVAYEIANGSIETGKLILHRCDNKLCCNPHHLYQGDQKQNMKDMTQRNRSTNKRLDQDDVNYIRRSKLPQQELADILGVSQQHISNIKNNKRREIHCEN